SLPTSIVLPEPEAPANADAPTITGLTEEGQTLTANPGTWTGYPAPTFTYEWLRCDADGNNCAPITDETGATYTLTADDVGKTVKVVVTASNGVGSPAQATSA